MTNKNSQFQPLANEPWTLKATEWVETEYPAPTDASLLIAILWALASTRQVETEYPAPTGRRDAAPLRALLPVSMSRCATRPPSMNVISTHRDCALRPNALPRCIRPATRNRHSRQSASGYHDRTPALVSGSEGDGNRMRQSASGHHDRTTRKSSHIRLDASERGWGPARAKAFRLERWRTKTRERTAGRDTRPGPSQPSIG